MHLLRGLDIAPRIEQLGRFRLAIFREYPYLYDGDLEYERRYLGRYPRSAESLLAFLEDARGLVGACTAIPLKDEDPEFQQPFRGEALADFFYIGEILLRPEARGQGLGTRLLARVIERIDAAGYPTTVLCTVERGPQHPSRPDGYVPPDALWRKFGFVPDAHRVVRYRWQDLGDARETEKPMRVWTRARAGRRAGERERSAVG